MSDLIPPHGGVGRPLNNMVAADEIAELKKQAAALAAVPLGDADLSSLYRIGDGGLSPLTGPMTKAVFDKVLADEVIESNGAAYAWTIPISFAVESDLGKSLKVGQTVRLTNSGGDTVGTLKIDDIFLFDKMRYLDNVYGTKRTDHPGGHMVLDDPRDTLLGGTVRVIPQPRHPVFGKYQLTPAETRALFAKRGWERVAAFQTRNPLHRAHEYAMVAAAETLTRQGHNAGIVLNPLVGETKSGDVDAATRMRTYETLVRKRLLGQGDKDEELWKRVGYDINDRLDLIALDIKMFYAGPKEAVMHAIYRQNFGFTDIVIGRKHADAPYDDGTDIWDGLAAQHKFDELAGDLKISPLKIGFAAYYEELGCVGLVDECSKKGWKPIPVTGRRVREDLAAGKLPDPRMMREETARILIESRAG